MISLMSAILPLGTTYCKNSIKKDNRNPNKVTFNNLFCILKVIKNPKGTNKQIFNKMFLKTKSKLTEFFNIIYMSIKGTKLYCLSKTTMPGKRVEKLVTKKTAINDIIIPQSTTNSLNENFLLLFLFLNSFMAIKTVNTIKETKRKNGIKPPKALNN